MNVAEAEVGAMLSAPRASSTIDPSARVAAGATIGAGVKIGPYCVIGPNVTLGDGCRLIAHVHLAGHTTIGARMRHPSVRLAGIAPAIGEVRGGQTRLVIGSDCDIRENITANIGTEDDGGLTVIGDHCFLMAGSHAPTIAASATM